MKAFLIPANSSNGMRKQNWIRLQIDTSIVELRHIWALWKRRADAPSNIGSSNPALSLGEICCPADDGTQTVTAARMRYGPG